MAPSMKVEREELANGDVKLTLPDSGDWLVFTTEPEHSRFNRFYKAWVNGMSDPAMALDLVSETIVALGVEGRLTGRDGHEQTLTPEGLEQVPERKLFALFTAFKADAKGLIGDLSPNE